ncbi:MAG: DUF4382 domain-containing protein [Halobacteriales archaeon]|nr:DUF4382 domain-containing protein [Halobacteriales archaeon]
MAVVEEFLPILKAMVNRPEPLPACRHIKSYMEFASRRSYLRALGTVPAIGAIAGCLGSDSLGTLATHVSDQPGDIADFDRLLIQISGVRVKPEDDDLVELDADAEVDLTELTGEASELIDETELDTGSYEFLQLDAEATEAVLTEGGSATVSASGRGPADLRGVVRDPRGPDHNVHR